MARILVFIDESGNPFENEIAFSTAAVWCAVERPEGREKPLKPTIDSMMQYFRDIGKNEWAKEIHHRDYPDEYAEYMLFHALEKVRSDNTILRDGSYWDGSPLRFTVADVNPYAINRLLPEMNCQMLGNHCRLSTLGNLLRPFYTYVGVEEIKADIIFDSEVWRSVIQRYDPGLNKIINNSRITVRMYWCKSSNTPGLQIADLAAGINRQYIYLSRQKAGYRLIQANALNRIFTHTI